MAPRFPNESIHMLLLIIRCLFCYFVKQQVWQHCWKKAWSTKHPHYTSRHLINGMVLQIVMVYSRNLIFKLTLCIIISGVFAADLVEIKSSCLDWFYTVKYLLNSGIPSSCWPLGSFESHLSFIFQQFQASACTGVVPMYVASVAFLLASSQPAPMAKRASQPGLQDHCPDNTRGSLSNEPWACQDAAAHFVTRWSRKCEDCELRPCFTLLKRGQFNIRFLTITRAILGCKWKWTSCHLCSAISLPMFMFMSII